MGFLQEYAALDTAPGTPGERAMAQLGLLQQWTVERPQEMFAELRATHPIFVTPGPVVVSLHQDVMEVVQMDDVFSVQPYGQAMRLINGGPNFVLGMDSSPQLQHDQSILRLAVKREDMDAIRQIVAAASQKVLNDALPTGRLELTDGFTRPVAAQLVAQYFGVPGPDTPTLLGWTRAMFEAIFLNFTQDAGIAAKGEQAGIEFRQYFDDLIAFKHQAHAAGLPLGDSVLERLIKMQAAPDASFSDAEIRNNLIGCIDGVIDNINSAVAGAMDVLLEHPDQLAAATNAAHAGDRETLRRYVLEALRFRPPAPLQVRFSLQDYTLARNTPRETKIPANKVVFAANGSAMMDETYVNDPTAWKLDRPEHEYLHFGWGLHQCLGKYIAQTALVEMFMNLLAPTGLRRAAGDDGQWKQAGAFPGPFVVAFDS